VKGLAIVENGIVNQLQGMVDRTNRMQAYLNRIVYKQYQNAQRERWMSENASEGTPWKALNPQYAKRKQIKFASYPGQGTKMLIATGQLQKDVIGPSSGGHRKLVTNKSIEVSWTTPYASYVEEVRPFAEFGDKTMATIYDGLAKFIIEGILKDLNK
jgi:hypothetical protein